MSQMLAYARASAPRARAAGHAVRQLRVVPTAPPSGGAVMGWCVALMVVGLVSLLSLNVFMAQGSYELHELQATSAELADTQDALEQAVTARSSPAALAARAGSMGMVPAESVAFIRLSDGRVLGVAEPATGERAFTVKTAPSVARP